MRRYLAFVVVVSIGLAPMAGQATPASGPLAVTLGGPPIVDAGVPATYTGSVRLSGAGVPGMGVEILSGTTPVATASTDATGSYSVAVSLSAGTHQVVAAVLRGTTTLESRSASMTVRSASRHNLTVVLAGTGIGRVRSSTGGIDCPGDCFETFRSTD
ncbi:MAG: hypothetical protein ACRDHY_08810, partial [Anaerolineales bacterium]